MKLRTLLCAALVAAVVIGCAPGIKPLDGGSALGCPGASCDVVEPLLDTPYGSRKFTIRDPDGTELGFVQAATS